MAKLVVAGITVPLRAFDLGLSLEVGSTTALVGPSGAGKTTVLRAVAGLVRPTAGRISCGDSVWFDAAGRVNEPPDRRRVGLVFQDYALFPHMTVRENIEFSRSDPADAYLERFRIRDLERARPGELSGGERQRVALARALARRPDVLLLDEPLSALDLPLRQALRDELRTILVGWGTAAVLVTHDLTEAYRLGDRIVVYEEGRVIQAAPRSELLWQPSSRSVARIMGLRNVLQGVTLKATSDRIQFRWRGQTLEAVNSPTHSYLPAADSPLAFFIRPEYVRLIRKDRDQVDSAHHMNLMSGTIVREVDFGATWILYFRLDEPGAPAQGDYDLEVEVPRLVYEILEIDRDRHWRFSLHRGSIHVLPSA